MSKKSKPYLSVVVPLVNESESINVLYGELTGVLKSIRRPYEIIFVNDGSTDASQKIIETLYSKDKVHVRGIEFRRNCGKAAALQAGFEYATGDIVITLDADLQDDPQEIPRFLEKLNEGYDLVSGWKKKRKDSFVKNNTSQIYNAVTNLLMGTTLHDNNCGFKAYRSEVVKNLHIYGELHRYIPVLVHINGYLVTEIPVHHRARKYGYSKYSLLRFIHGPLDLLTIVYLTRFRMQPLHFFGYIGLSCFSLGFLFALYLTGVKFLLNQSIGTRPLLLFSVLLMMMGVQIGITGLVSEQLTSTLRQTQKSYKIKKVLN